MLKNKKYKTLDDLHNDWVKDSVYSKAYHDLDLEFSIISAMIEARVKKGLTQEKLAEKMGTKQSSIARFESGRYNPTLAFVQKLVNAIGVRIKIS